MLRHAFDLIRLYSGGTVELRYIGPSESVVISVDGVDVELPRGKAVELPTKLARRLLEQSTFSPAETRGKTTKGS